MGERLVIPILSGHVDVELTPPQPPEVAAAVAEALAEDAPEAHRGPDPWWLQGLEEQLAP